MFFICFYSLLSAGGVPFGTLPSLSRDNSLLCFALALYNKVAQALCALNILVVTADLMAQDTTSARPVSKTVRFGRLIASVCNPR